MEKVDWTERGGADGRSFPALGTAKRPVLEISGNLLRPNSDGRRGCSVFLLDVCVIGGFRRGNMSRSSLFVMKNLDVLADDGISIPPDVRSVLTAKLQ
ncbi:MAG: hypothetical protein HDS02_03850 [Bacteroides sp.]|nr:hypothetical protein [Bacteroides sp.]MBD5331852.1 hypothetical protein [Bacteroides sp.]MBD5375059.1 hypothetical protein [Bacteroides sp.]MBD5375512.1 hypothetical protein [Bacteroides sp.]